MKIRMLTTACGPDFAYNAGSVYEVADAIAKGFIEASAAVRADGVEEIEEAVAEPQTETAVSKKRKG